LRLQRKGTSGLSLPETIERGTSSKYSTAVRLQGFGGLETGRTIAERAYELGS
jgi:hypothetical protein